MKRCVYSILFLLFLMVINACKTDDDFIPVTEIQNLDDTIFEIKEWLLIGPTTFDTIKQNPSETYSNAENLSLGFDENGITRSTFKKLKKGKIQLFYANRMNAYLNFFDYVIGKPEDKANFYTYAYVESKFDRNMILVSDGCSSYSIWVNGNKLVESTGKPEASKLADKFIHIKLKKGKNLLFAKINRGNNTDSWKLIVGLTGIQYAKNLFKVNYMSDFINNPCVKSELSIYTGPYSEGNVLIIKDSFQLKYIFKEKDIKNGFLNIRLPGSITEGYCKCKLCLGLDTLENVFFYGDFSTFICQKLTWLNISGAENNAKSDLIAAQGVINYYNDSVYLKKKGINPGISNSTRFEYAKSLVEALEFANENKNLVNKPGNIIKSLKDELTGRIKIFLFHVDRKVIDSKKKFPLMLVPVCDTINTLLLQSSFLYNLNQIAIDGRLADNKGFAICWVFLDGRGFNLENATNEVTSVLTSLSRDYPMLDTSALFIYGEGIGGYRAIMLAEMQPQKYSGLAVFNPFLVPDSTINSPLNLSINLINIYGLLLHGQKFEGSKFSSFRKFVEVSREIGWKKLSYKQFEFGKLEFSHDYKIPVFEYFAKIHHILPLQQPYFIRFRTNDNTFRNAYWISYQPLNETTVTEIVIRRYPYSSKITLKCKNISTLKIDSKKLGIPVGKELQYSINGKKRKVEYDKSGNILLSILPIEGKSKIVPAP